MGFLNFLRTILLNSYLQKNPQQRSFFLPKSQLYIPNSQVYGSKSLILQDAILSEQLNALLLLPPRT